MGRLIELDYAPFKATDKERSASFLQNVYPEFVRDVRKRVPVCNCADANRAAYGETRATLARTGRDEPFDDVIIKPTADGACGYCGYTARLVIL